MATDALMAAVFPISQVLGSTAQRALKFCLGRKFSGLYFVNTSPSRMASGKHPRVVSGGGGLVRFQHSLLAQHVSSQHPISGRSRWK
jgi:hypothetical protein